MRLFAVGVLAGCATAQLQWDCDGKKIYEYDYEAVVNASTRDISGAVSGNGTHAQVRATHDTSGGLLLRCNSANATHYEFQMNIGNAVIYYEDKAEAAPGVCTQPCSDDDAFGPVECCGEMALGQDVYFTQAVTGEVSTISTSSDDSDYFVQIKLGAINAFHTILKTTPSYSGTETDVTGVHTTAFTSAKSSTSHTITKSFTQSDVQQFADTTLQQHNVEFVGTGAADIHPTAGYVRGASFKQTATLVDIRSSSGGGDTDVAAAQAATDSSMSGFEAELHSGGEVHITEKASTTRKYAAGAAPYLLAKPTAQHQPVASLLHAARASMARLQLKQQSPGHPALASTVGGAGPETFNKSWAKSHHFGGSTIGADLAASAFAGTNLGACNSSYFNYAARAEAFANLKVFKGQWTPFYATLEYGQEDGQQLADQIVLQVFNKTVYTQALKAADVDCSEHTHQLVHSTPGASVKHTLWMGPIPLTLSAGVAIDMSVEWGWHFCETDLSADVYIKPQASLTVTGSAELNLLIIDATVEMQFAANTAVQPDLSISGTKCDVGLEVDLVRSPADTGVLRGFYNRRKCKYLFFDCKMEEAGEKTFWNWEAASERTVLLNESWPIAKPAIESPPSAHFLEAKEAAHAAGRKALRGGARVPSFVNDPANDCSDKGTCGNAYQACCIAFQIKGYPCGCHLQDGTGKVGADCGDCGVAFGACCIAETCKCDIS